MRFSTHFGGFRQISFILLMILTFLPQAAFALSFFDVRADDLSVNLLLAPLFQGALPTGTSAAGADPLAGMFGAFNAGILTIAGVLAAYNLVVGTMQTAHHGEMLGKQWSSMWLPIRMALGTSLVVPLGSGYCIAQVLVIWLAMQGIGLATKTWEAFVDTGFTELAKQINVQTVPIDDLMNKATKIQICMKSIERDIQENPALYASADLPKTTPLIKGGQTVGTQFGTTSNPSLCGQFEYNLPTPGAQEKVKSAINQAQNAYSSGGGLISGSSSAVSTYFSSLSATNLETSAIRQTHTTSINDIFSKATPLADYIVQASQVSLSGSDRPRVDATSSSLVQQADQSIAQYRQQLRTAGQSAMNSSVQGARDRIKEGGWLMAGSWFVKIARVTSSITDEMNRVPTVSVNNLDEDVAGYEIWKKSTAIYQAITEQGFSTEKGKTDYSNRDEDGLMTKLTKILIEGISGINIETVASTQAHPILVIERIGAELSSSMFWIIAAFVGLGAALSIGGAIIGGAAGAIFGGGAVAGASAGLTTFFQPLIMLCMTLIFTCIATGMYLQIYFPMMPFIFFFFGGLAWILIVVQAMIAAPLWAVMHITGSGDDIMGGSRTGYSLLLSMTVRPALLIFGFAAAIVVSYPIGALFNAIFFESFSAVSNSNSGGLYPFFFIIIGTFLYAVLMTNLMHKCFSLIHIVPNEVLQWFGGHGSQIGQSAQQASQEASSALKQTLGGSVLGGLASGLGQGSNSMMGGITQRRANAAQGASEGNKQMSDLSNSFADIQDKAASIEGSQSKSQLADIGKDMEHRADSLDQMGSRFGGARNSDGSIGFKTVSEQTRNQHPDWYNSIPSLKGQYSLNETGQAQVSQIFSAADQARDVSKSAYAKAGQMDSNSPSSPSAPSNKDPNSI